MQQVHRRLENIGPFQLRQSRNEWKRIVKEAILAVNQDELKQEIKEKYKKLKHSELTKQTFGRKIYIKDLNLQQARTKFKFRCSMTQIPSYFGAQDMKT